MGAPSPHRPRMTVFAVADHARIRAPFHGVRWRSADAAVPPLGGGRTTGTAETRELAWSRRGVPGHDTAWGVRAVIARRASLRRDGRVLELRAGAPCRWPRAFRSTTRLRAAGRGVGRCRAIRYPRRPWPSSTTFGALRRPGARPARRRCRARRRCATWRPRRHAISRASAAKWRTCAGVLMALSPRASTSPTPIGRRLARRARVLPDHVGAVLHTPNTARPLRHVGRLAAASRNDAFDDTFWWGSTTTHWRRWWRRHRSTWKRRSRSRARTSARCGGCCCRRPPSRRGWRPRWRSACARSAVGSRARRRSPEPARRQSALRTVQQLPDDAPEIVGVAWAPAASTDGVATPPLPHLAADTAAARRLVEVRERSQPAVGVQRRAPAPRARAGASAGCCRRAAPRSPRCCRCRRLVVETGYCVRYAAHLWQTVGATEAAAFPLDDFQGRPRRGGAERRRLCPCHCSPPRRPCCGSLGAGATGGAVRRPRRLQHDRFIAAPTPTCTFTRRPGAPRRCRQRSRRCL